MEREGVGVRRDGRRYAVAIGAAVLVLVLVLVAAVASWVALGLPSLSHREVVPQGASGDVVLTSAEPVAVRQVLLAFPAAGQHVTTWAEVAIRVPPTRPEPVSFGVVRDSDGKQLALGPLEGGLQALGRTFTPFDTCGPDTCGGTFTITFRLTGKDLGRVTWTINTRTEFGEHPAGNPVPTIEVSPV